jgi:superfamily II DNA or RNA helicase
MTLDTLVNFTEAEIRPFFTANALSAGALYCQQLRVQAFERNGDIISAKVQGNELKAYRQSILVEREGGRLRISSSCTCPIGFNCKHVAAALFEHFQRRSNPSHTRSRPLPAVIYMPPEKRPPPPALIPAPPRPARPPAPPEPDALPPDLAGWLQRLEQAVHPDSEAYSASTPGRLLYLLAPSWSGAGTPNIKVEFVTVRVLKSGGYSSSTGRFHPESIRSSSAPKHLRPSDFRIFRAMRPDQYQMWSNSEPFVGEYGVEILRLMVATGRAHWLAATGPRLTFGEPRPAAIVWRFAEAETMRPFIDAGDGIVALNARPPLYVDPAAGLIGEFDTGLEPKLTHALLSGPAVSPRHVKTLGEKMTKHSPALADFVPADPGPPIPIEVVPKPVLRLSSAQLPWPNRSYYLGNQPPMESVAVARLVFRYEAFEVPFGDSRETITRVRERRVYEVRRDAARESSALVALEDSELGLASVERPNAPKANAHDFVHPDGESGWFHFLYSKAPKLRAAGIEVEIAADFPFRVLSGDGEVSAEIGEGSGIDWLEFGLGIMHEGERIDLIEPIVAMIARGAYDPERPASEIPDTPVFVPLGGGRFIAIAASRFEPILRAIYELAGGADGDGGKLRITRADALGLGEVEAALGASLVWRGGERLREMGRKLAASGGIPAVSPPPDFTAELRPYQAQGVAWLAFLRDVGMGGILADDMGLGKTVQALALIAIEKAASRLDAPALVVAPTSLMANWRREAEKFAPNLRVLTLQGSDRKARFDAISESDLVLTTYPLIARDSEIISSRRWHLLLLDEAQTIKNPDAATTKLIRGLDARHRFCLTGTPLENHLGELWSLFAFASPGFLGDRAHFTKHWRTPIEKKGSGERGRLLSKRIRPFILRRTKAEVAPELPPKTEIVERIELESSQREIYESIRLAMHQRVRDAIADKGFARSRIVILDALLKLRQACCDPRLLKLTSAIAAKAGSAKLERLMELLEELIAEGRKIIVFSQFTSMLDLIEPRLAQIKAPFSLLTGQTRDREAAINRFRDGATPVFLISLKAGGTGLNLTEADTIVLYDPWWNPAVEEQAIDRAHRIGQDKPVFVHKLVATGTIEEKMDVLKEKKRALAQNLFDADGAPTLAMTEADLDVLFEGE